MRLRVSQDCKSGVSNFLIRLTYSHSKASQVVHSDSMSKQGCKRIKTGMCFNNFIYQPYLLQSFHYEGLKLYNFVSLIGALFSSLLVPYPCSVNLFCNFIVKLRLNVDMCS